MKLDIQKLCMAYDGETVLKDLSLQVKEGEFISLLGPSGCGKSTLIKAVAGIVPQEGGKITLGDTDITGLPIHRRGTVVVFQDMRLFPHISVAQNVAFPLKMEGIQKRERLEQAKELLKMVQMEGFEHRLPNELSGGQQQRVALARALAARPKLLLLDEPFSALDENLREDMRELVLRLHRRFNMTTILVTHDREEALSLSDRVAVMWDGKILQMDTPKELYSRPKSRQVADYFGDCTYLSGRVVDGVFEGQGVSLSADVPDGAYQLLLRPCNFLPEKEGSYPVTVQSVRFRGGDTLVTFAAEGGLSFKKTYIHSPHWNAGDRLKAGLSIEEPVLFPMED